MSELEVDIVDLPPMRVASAHGYGQSPETLAWDKILGFARANGIDVSQARFFGFNNPNPSPGSPNYGYEQWMTVGPEVEAEGDIVIREVPGRRYAVTRFKGLENIGRVWQELVLWFEESSFKKPSHWCECLEELLTPLDVPLEEYEFNLYLPVAS